MSVQTPAPSNDEAESCSTVFLRSEPVELYKILKFEGLAASGAEAKLLIDEGLVQVNGEDEFRRRRKIVNNDRIHFDGRLYRVVTDADG
ncbi:RNA-binding S4 domain-containing protein [Granulosicoccus sp. 3-233]|uniref:RNA-binding S4 domain-containing protein n=1 Tax=Granulosicoccus sp. 3-233 TaxID=3417969 RepID=UPI003D357710